jgi:MFS family permease
LSALPLAQRNLLETPVGRRTVFALLYVSEGAPIGFVWWAMPSLLRAQGVDLAAITTLTSLATLPWVLKFLIAPVIDSSLGTVSLRRWIVACQLTMAAVLLPLIWIDWSANFSIVVAVVVVHAAFAAVQDVAIDTFAIHSVPAEELGRVNGWMQVGMLGGRALVAAGSALVAAAFGSPGAAVVCVALLVVSPALVLLVVAVPVVPRSGISLRSLLHVFQGRGVLAGIFVALVIGAGFEFFGVSVGPRLVDAGGSGAAIAAFYGLVAPAGLAVGALLGGHLADRMGVVRATGISLLALTAVLSAVAANDLSGEAAAAQLPLAGLAYLGTGALTASSYALFMGLARGSFAATRFSLFMAMTNACEAWAGFVGGRFAEYSYGLTLLVLAGIACLAVLPLRLLQSELKGGIDEPRTSTT